MPCVQCGAATCVGCLVSDACPACYHAWQEMPETPALARQHQEWRAIRKGTQPLLDSGIARAELLHDHGVRPHFVGKVLRAEVDRSRQVLATMAVSRPTVKNTLLIEYSCHPDSSMSAAWMASGGQALRVCLPDYDVSRPRTVARIGDFAKGAMNRGLNSCAAARHLAMHSLERADAHSRCDLTNISLAPRAPEEPVKKDAQAPRGLARQAARPQVRREL